MNQLVSDDLWKRVKWISGRSKTKRAAIAYVSTDKYLKFGKGDVLIVDASNESIACGNTSAIVLDRAYRRQARLYSLSKLHAKAMLFDRTAVVGSANASASSANELTEAAVISDHPSVVSNAAALIELLAEKAVAIGPKFLKRILAIKVKRSGGRGHTGVRKQRRAKLGEHRTWIVGVHEMDENEHPEEEPARRKGEREAKKFRQLSSSSVSWIRCTDNSLFTRRAKRGHSVIVLSREEGQKLPHTVISYSPILWRQTEAKCTRFFYEDFKGSENTALTWGQFKKLAVRAELPFKVLPNTTRLVSEDDSETLHSLWKKAK
jgi:hypothetical protein